MLSVVIYFGLRCLLGDADTYNCGYIWNFSLRFFFFSFTTLGFFVSTEDFCWFNFSCCILFSVLLCLNIIRVDLKDETGNPNL